MTANQFVTRLVWINLPVLMLICGINYLIDGGSTHHLPGEASLFPRTTAHSTLSKIHYLSIERPDTVYFGSSRVEVGLPSNPDLVGGGKVYNAGLSGANLYQWAPFVRHTLALTEPRRIVIGVDFSSFTTKSHTSNSNLDLSLNSDLSLLSSNYFFYLTKRIPYDLRQALSIKALQNSIQSITTLFHGMRYDKTQQIQSVLGQLTEVNMQALTEERGKADKAFKQTIKAAFIKPSEDIADENAWRIFENLLAEICQKGIVTRIFIHPVHALASDAIRQNGAWFRLEQWKTELASLATRYQLQQCDVKIVDFSGYNITTESIHGLSPTKSLHYYWEASHYKSSVGEMILKRLFSTSVWDLPQDFGRELRNDTVDEVLTAIREEQASYLLSHSEDNKLVQKWMSEKNKGGFVSKGCN